MFSLIKLNRIEYSGYSEKIGKDTSIFCLLAPMKHVSSVVESKSFMERIEIIKGISRDDKNRAALEALKTISTNEAFRFIWPLIKVSPTAEELGISNLIK